MGRISLLLIIPLILSIPTPLYALWIWSPETGWINEKDIVKESPKAQWEYAQRFEREKKYSRAARAYKALIKAYPASPYAAKAQERIAICHEKDGNYYEAFKAYQTLIETYPQHINFEYILKQECRIGEAFIKGKRRKLWKFPIVPAVDKGIEILETVLTNAPYSSVAPRAQYMLGVGYKRLKKYNKAADAFIKCYKEYPESEYAEKTLFQAGLCLYRQSKGPAYDQAATNKALKVLSEFSQKFPTSKFLPKVNTIIRELKGRKAEGVFKIGLFYEKQGYKKSAIMYYDRVIKQFPESGWAEEAQKKLQILKTKPE